MKRLVSRLFVFLSLLSILMICLYFISGALSKNHRLGTAYLKHNRLSKITGNKVILVGGSNLHYGVNSQLLEDSLGLEVVNMGIQGSIGMEYYFNEIIDDVKKDDIVIFLGEPAHYYKLPKEGEQTLYTLVSKYPPGINYLNFNQFRNSVMHLGVAIQENIEYFLTLLVFKITNKNTILEQTNGWGDYEGHKDKKTLYTPKESANTAGIEEIARSINSAVSYLKRMEEGINSKGAHLFIGFSPASKSAEEIDVFQMIDKEISNQFSHTKLGIISEYVFPDEYFYDTSYHLLYSKRNKRTRMLIRNIWDNKNTADILQNIVRGY